jgi:hypothetical protein
MKVLTSDRKPATTESYSNTRCHETRNNRKLLELTFRHWYQRHPPPSPAHCGTQVLAQAQAAGPIIGHHHPQRRRSPPAAPRGGSRGGFRWLPARPPRPQQTALYSTGAAAGRRPPSRRCRRPAGLFQVAGRQGRPRPSSESAAATEARWTRQPLLPEMSGSGACRLHVLAEEQRQQGPLEEQEEEGAGTGGSGYRWSGQQRAALSLRRHRARGN